MTSENPFLALTPRVAKWHVEKQARHGGTYRVLSRGSGKERVSLSLGYLDDEVAAQCEHGMNALASWRATVAAMFDRLTGPGAFPPPDRAVDAPIAYPNFPQGDKAGPVDVPPDISPEWLIRLCRVAGKAPAKQQAREKTLSFLVAMHAVWPPTRAEPPKLDMDALRVALRSSQRADPGGLSLSEYLEEVWKPVRAERKPQLWTDEEGHWTRYILPVLGHIRVRDLDGPRFEGFITTVRGAKGQLLARSTLNSVKNAYRQALDHASRRGHVAALHAFFKLQVGTKAVLATPQPLTRAEVERVVAAATSPMHRALFAFAFDEGGRPSESVSLDWSDVFFDAISERNPDGRVRIPGTKTATSDGIIPLWPSARKHLLEWWPACGRPTSGPVFTWRGKTYSGHTTYRTALKTAARRAGITDRRVFPYLTRHTFATNSLLGGADENETALAMRHTNAKMVKLRYGHVQPADVLDARRFDSRRTKE